MAFNNQEQEIIRWGLQNGKSRQEVETAISNYRTGYIPPKQAQPEQSQLGSQLAERAKTFGKEALTLGTLGASTMTPQDFNATGQDRTLAALEGLSKAGLAPWNMLGAAGGAVGDIVGAGLQATGLDKPIGQALAPIAQSEVAQKAVQAFQSLPQEYQDYLKNGLNASNLIGIGIGKKVAGQAIDTGASLVAKGLDAVPTSKLSLSGLDEMAQNSLKKDISSLLTATRSISNKAKLAEQKGVNLNEILSDPQIYRGIKVENAKIVPDEAIKVVDDRISQLMEAKKNILPEVDRLVPKQSREVLRTKAYEDIKGKFTPADEVDIKSAIDKQIDALPEEMSVSEIDAFRARARASARDAKGLQKRSSEYSALENSARDTVFNLTDNLPVANAQDFKAINDYIKQMIETQGFLDKTLRNQVVKGGRLRNYAMRTVGAIAGAKGGALGAIAGSEIGGLVADIITNNQLGSSFKMNLIRNITDDPAILKQAEDLLKGVQGLSPNKSLQNTANSTIKTSSIPNTVQPKESVVNELINNPMRGSVTPSEFLPKKKVETPQTNLEDAKQALREAKGLSASDIMSKHPDIQLKRDVPVTDVRGNKAVIPQGEALTPYELKGNKVLLQDGETYIVSKNQYQNIKGQSLTGEAKPFAPELKNTEESVKGGAPIKTFDDIKWTGNSERLVGTMGKRKFGITKEQDGYYVFEQDGILGKQVKNYTQAVEELNRYLGKENPTTKYSGYTLPGGKNYKEILIKAPEGKVPKTLDQIANENYSVDYRELNVRDKDIVAKIHDKQDLGQFKSSHWDEPNVISHLRLNERTYNGKKVTFMEELQSDWAREGRDKGFANENPTFSLKETPQHEWSVVDNNGRVISLSGTKDYAQRRLNEIKLGGLDKHLQGVPNNPLLKNWQEVSIKRALKDAVDNGSDYFAWINGEQTSARYNLATYVDDVKWNRVYGNKVPNTVIDLERKGGGTIDIRIDNEGKIKQSLSEPSWNGKQLDEVLGKGLADKIMEKESGTLSGEGLKFGGEWANNLYDKQVKNIVEDLTGAKVEMLDMGLPVGTENKGWFVNDSGATRPPLTKTNIKVGQSINGQGGDYIITDVLGDGKFKAVPKYVADNLEAIKNGTRKSVLSPDDALRVEQRGYEQAKETFDISTPKTSQMGIKLTPEIKAKINSMPIKFKVSGKINWDKVNKK